MATYIRLNSGEAIDGTATVCRGWHDLDGTERLDLLQDWSGLIAELYDAERNAQNGAPYTPNPTCLKAIKYQRRK